MRALGRAEMIDQFKSRRLQIFNTRYYISFLWTGGPVRLPSVNFRWPDTVVRRLRAIGPPLMSDILSVKMFLQYTLAGEMSQGGSPWTRKLPNANGNAHTCQFDPSPGCRTRASSREAVTHTLAGELTDVAKQHL